MKFAFAYKSDAMKKSTFIGLAICLLSPLIYAGTETYSGKEMKQVAPQPCPEWYADNEFNGGKIFMTAMLEVFKSETPELKAM